MAFTLVNARPSPFGRKVAIVLVEKGLPYEVDYDLPWGEGTRTPEFSPLEQLPILVTEAGEHIYDSAYIVDWLEQRYPQPALLPGPRGRLAAVAPAGYLPAADAPDPGVSTSPSPGRLRL